MNSNDRAWKEEMWMAAFSLRLQRMMKEANVDIYELSEKTGIHRRTLKGYFSGRISPKAYNLWCIAKVLKSSFDDILDL